MSTSVLSFLSTKHFKTTKGKTKKYPQASNNYAGDKNTDSYRG
ncbi:unnamed protein product [marine sediment metagenome]|uniref:Uncharacterized protein n=1 Tax=marine sediment metagenome TaxID=412755 RepID=X1UYX0_9ZZZZ